ncbi:MAG: hypothetical protein KY476_20385 [Planctomycetes bacterium]|nr:hypothetical protein [Planctomycetota bacterium]
MVRTATDAASLQLSETELRSLQSLNRTSLPPAPPPKANRDGLPSPERVEWEIQEMLATEPGPDFLRWVDEYAAVGKRNPYLWRWCRRAVELTTLSSVAAEWREELIDTKTLGVMWDVMLDDVADRGGDPRMLEMLLGVMEGTAVASFSDCSAAERPYAAFTVRLWKEIESRARRYPRFAEFESLLRFDYRQLANVMRYSHLLNRNLDLLNLSEHDLYTPHNMHIMICSTFDMMCSPGFDRRELGLVREMVWQGQCMGRIGNLVTTWERELGERDFTSGVYARAVSRGDVTVERLLTAAPDEIRAIIQNGGHEQYFLRRWRAHQRRLTVRAASIHSFDAGQYVEGFERLICLHLGSRGRK